jgi:hypothetical protein
LGKAHDWLKSGVQPTFMRPTLQNAIEKYASQRGLEISSSTKIDSTPIDSISIPSQATTAISPDPVIRATKLQPLDLLGLTSHEFDMVKFLWQTEFQESVTEERQFKKDCKTMWALLLQALDTTMEIRVDSNQDYKAACEDNFNLYKLWTVIRTEATNKESMFNEADGWGTLISVTQESDSFERYCQRFRDALKEFDIKPPQSAQIGIFLRNLNKTANQNWMNGYIALPETSKPTTLEGIILNIRRFNYQFLTFNNSQHQPKKGQVRDSLEANHTQTNDKKPAINHKQPQRESCWNCDDPTCPR